MYIRSGNRSNNRLRLISGVLLYAVKSEHLAYDYPTPYQLGRGSASRHTRRDKERNK